MRLELERNKPSMFSNCLKLNSPLVASQIYSSCKESYRLTESGNLNVPHDYTDQYCNGPCLTETHLVLDCIEGILYHFVFYNKATIKDVRDTIKAGCGYGPERG